jgi:glycosyltransferase involved in cell wall biosynthesis
VPDPVQRAVVVCPLLPFPPESGGHKRTLRLLEAIQRAGAAPHLLTTDPRPEAAAAARDRDWSVDAVAEPRPTLASRTRQHVRRLPTPLVPALARRLSAMASGGCAFVQLEHAQSASYLPAARGARVVLSLHNIDSELLGSVARGHRPLTPGWARAWGRWQAMRALERRGLPLADAVLCVSDDDARLIADRSGPVVVVPNGVDDDLFGVDPALPADERVLFFGRLDYAPNAHGLERMLREVWPRVAADRPGAVLRIAGPGRAPGVEAAARGAERVELLGFVPDLRGELERARAIAVPVWQGGGTRLKVLEGLAAARPLVGTALGVAGIGFEHGRHGLVADEPAAFAEAVASLLGDANRSRQLAAEGRALAERFRWRSATAVAEELYRGWLHRTNVQPAP